MSTAEIVTTMARPKSDLLTTGRILHRVTEVRLHWKGTHTRVASTAVFACGKRCELTRLGRELRSSTRFILDPEEANQLTPCDGCLHPDRQTQKLEARALVTQAIANGLLTRQPCEECANPKADAHHDDYSKPLKVRWLCRRDHQKWHKAFKASFGVAS